MNPLKNARFMLAVTATWIAALATTASANNSTITTAASTAVPNLTVTLRTTAGGAITDQGKHQVSATGGGNFTLRAELLTGTVRARTQFLDGSGNPVAGCVANDVAPAGGGAVVVIGCAPGLAAVTAELFLD
jgi:hypothetical protein